MMARRLRLCFLLCLLLTVSTIAYVQSNEYPIPLKHIIQADSFVQATKNPALENQLASPVIKIVELYIDDVQLSEQENTIQYAIELDHNHGRPAINNRNYPKAYEIYQKVLAISYNHSSLMGIAIGLQQIATIQKFMGNHEAEIDLELAAYDVAKILNNPYETGVVALRLARYFEKKDRLIALNWRLLAKEYLEGTPYKQDYIYLLQDLARDYRYIGQDEKGYEMFEVAFNESRDFNFAKNDLYIKYYILRSYVESLYRLDRCDEAIAIANQNLPEHSTDASINQSRLTIMNYKAHCFKKLNLVDEANQQFVENWYYVSILRELEHNDQSRAKFDKRNYSIVNTSIKGLIDQHEYKAALMLLESNKSKTLYEIKSDKAYSKKAAQRSEANRALQKQKYQAFVKFFKDGASPEKYIELAKDIDEKQSHYDQTILETELNFVEQEIKPSSVMDSQQLQSIQKQLDKQTTVVSYFASNETVFAFTLTHDTLNLYPLDISSKLLRVKVKELQASLQNPFNDYYIEPSRYLHDVLIAPLQLESKTKLIYVTDDYLSVIPLGVLHNGSTFVAHQFELMRLTSLNHFKPRHQLKTVRVKKGVICVDPALQNQRLPLQLETGHFLHRLYSDNTQLLSGENCTINQLEQALEDTQEKAFLHIGAHGFFYTEDPMKSGITLLAKDGKGAELWDAETIATAQMANVHLVTLSSCETGLIDTGVYRDTFGIIRSLYYAGADNIIAPLWSVHTQATAKFMQQFYSHYVISGNILEALKITKSSFIETTDLSHPFYWAAFVNVGGAV